MYLASLPFSKASENAAMGFIGFALLIAGVVLVLSGIVIYSKAKREWNLYYDQRDQVDNPDVKRRSRDKKKGIILLVVGLVMFVASLFIN